MNDILQLTDIEKKGVCRCNKCNGVFNQSEIEHLRQTRIDCVCPYCGSTSFGRINPIVDEEYNTYKSRSQKKYYKKDIMNRYEVNDDEELEFYTHGYLIK